MPAEAETGGRMVFRVILFKCYFSIEDGIFQESLCSLHNKLIKEAKKK